MTERRLISSGSTFESEIGYSRAVVNGDWVHVSGTTGYDYSAMTISADVAEQAEQSLRNIQAALTEAGSSLADVVRVRYLLPHRSDFETCWPVLKQWFGEIRPAATMMVCGLADPEMKIEIEVDARRRVAAGGGAMTDPETTNPETMNPGTMNPEATTPDSADREMYVPGMFNLRDLGGLPVRGGGTVRAGRLLRSGELSGLQPAGAAMFAELGLRTVVDLRTLDEIAARPDVLDGTKATVHPIPLLALAYHEIPAVPADLYTYMADHCEIEIARAVKALAAPGALPGLFHCAVGKDRTGVLAAVILALIGVPDDEVIADFVRSNAALGLPRRPGVPSVAAQKVAEASPVYDMLLSARNAVQADVMATFLARVRERHGSVAEYLRSGGVTDDELASLEAELVEIG